MSDNTPAPKLSMLDRIREFLDSLGATEADELETDELDTEAADDANTEADDAETLDDTETVADEAAAAENMDGADTTPGTESAAADTAEDDDLRAIITEQASQLETYRNALAVAGLPDPLEAEEEIDAALDADDTPTEEDLIRDYDEDYTRQEAMLAELREN